MARAPIIIREKMFVPIKRLDEDVLMDNYAKRLYNQSKCERCPYLPERHGENCENCPQYLGRFKLYNEVEINGKQYFGLPMGNRTRLKEVVYFYDKYKKQGLVIDERPTKKMKYPIKFTGKLWPPQKPVVADMLKAKYGILESPPRTGKTIMAIYMACKRGEKTLILASQHDWLEQFYETITEHTDAKDIEAWEEKKIYGICNTLEDFKKYDICLSTYQKFITKNGKKLLEKVKNLFPFVATDEVHDVGAACYAKVISQFNAKFKIGLTGTFDRKDGKIFLVKELIGPVKAKSKAISVRPHLEIVPTKLPAGRTFRSWTYATRFIADCEERNEQIAQDAVKYAMKLKRSVLIPVMHVKHAQTLVDMINDIAGKTIAVAFTAQTLNKKNRRSAILKARSGKYKVVVGIRKLVQVGLNVPIWSALFHVMPINNKPKYLQEIGRICTPMDDKPTPIIRYYADNFKISQGCFRGMWWQVINPGKFDMTPETRQRAMEHMGAKMKNLGTGYKRMGSKL